MDHKQGDGEQRNFGSLPPLPVDGVSVERAEYEIALEVFGFIKARVIAGEPVDPDSLSAALDSVVPDWRQDDFGALSGAEYLASSACRQPDSSDGDADQTALLAMCHLHDRTWLASRIRQAAS
jgi:hypothetical protein